MPYNKKNRLSIPSIAFRLKKYEYGAVFPNSLRIHVFSTDKNKTKKARTGHKERGDEALYNNMHNNSQQRLMRIFWSAATETGDVYELSGLTESSSALFQIKKHLGDRFLFSLCYPPLLLCLSTTCQSLIPDLAFLEKNTNMLTSLIIGHNFLKYKIHNDIVKWTYRYRAAQTCLFDMKEPVRFVLKHQVLFACVDQCL